jgi:RNA polymerase sigma-70 factor, ECF subfamily
MLTQTNPSIFVRLKGTDTRAREVAWHEFHHRYAPVIAAFARRLGVRNQDLDDLVQDVMLGFFAKSPTFVYDPDRGRFRRYLMTCVCHVMSRRRAGDWKLSTMPLERVDEKELGVDQIWNDVWEHQQILLAVEQIRHRIGTTKAFRAFELYVILNLPADEVAQKLKVHLDSVYRAKEQVSALLRRRIKAMRLEQE